MNVAELRDRIDRWLDRLSDTIIIYASWAWVETYFKSIGEASTTKI
jgi:hypothetical protein